MKCQDLFSLKNNKKEKNVTIPSATNFAGRFTFLLLNTTCPVLANSVDPISWLDLHCLSLNIVNFNQKYRSSYLIGWKLEVDVAS